MRADAKPPVTPRRVAVVALVVLLVLVVLVAFLSLLGRLRPAGDATPGILHVEGTITDFVVTGDEIVWVDALTWSIRARRLRGGSTRVVKRVGRPVGNLAVTSHTLFWREEGSPARLVAIPLPPVASATPIAIVENPDTPLPGLEAWADGALVVMRGDLKLLDAKGNAVRTLAPAGASSREGGRSPGDTARIFSFRRAGDRVVFSVWYEGRWEVRSVPLDGSPGRVDATAPSDHQVAIELLGATHDRWVGRHAETGETFVVDAGVRRSLGVLPGTVSLRSVEADGDLYFTLRQDAPRVGMERLVYRLRRGSSTLELIVQMSLSQSNLDRLGDELFFVAPDGIRGVDRRLPAIREQRDDSLHAAGLPAEADVCFPVRPQRLPGRSLPEFLPRLTLQGAPSELVVSSARLAPRILREVVATTDGLLLVVLDGKAERASIQRTSRSGEPRGALREVDGEIDDLTVMGDLLLWTQRATDRPVQTRSMHTMPARGGPTRELLPAGDFVNHPFFPAGDDMAVAEGTDLRLLGGDLRFRTIVRYPGTMTVDDPDCAQKLFAASFGLATGVAGTRRRIYWSSAGDTVQPSRAFSIPVEGGPITLLASPGWGHGVTVLGAPDDRLVLSIDGRVELREHDGRSAQGKGDGAGMFLGSAVIDGDLYVLLMRLVGQGTFQRVVLRLKRGATELVPLFEASSFAVVDDAIYLVTADGLRKAPR